MSQLLKVAVILLHRAVKRDIAAYRKLDLAGKALMSAYKEAA